MKSVAELKLQVERATKELNDALSLEQAKQTSSAVSVETLQSSNWSIWSKMNHGVCHESCCICGGRGTDGRGILVEDLFYLCKDTDCFDSLQAICEQRKAPLTQVNSYDYQYLGPSWKYS